MYIRPIFYKGPDNTVYKFEDCIYARAGHSNYYDRHTLYPYPSLYEETDPNQ